MHVTNRITKRVTTVTTLSSVYPQCCRITPRQARAVVSCRTTPNRCTVCRPSASPSPTRPDFGAPPLPPGGAAARWSRRAGIRDRTEGRSVALRDAPAARAD